MEIKGLRRKQPIAGQPFHETGPYFRRKFREAKYPSKFPEEPDRPAEGGPDGAARRSRIQTTGNTGKDTRARGAAYPKKPKAPFHGKSQREDFLLFAGPLPAAGRPNDAPDLVAAFGRAK